MAAPQPKEQPAVVVVVVVALAHQLKLHPQHLAGLLLPGLAGGARDQGGAGLARAGAQLQLR